MRLRFSDFMRRVETTRSEEHTSELQSQSNLVCRLLLDKKKRALPKAAGLPLTDHVSLDSLTLTIIESRAPHRDVAMDHDTMIHTWLLRVEVARSIYDL